MHPRILGATLLVTALGATAQCAAPGAPVVERFIAADCAACWAAELPAADARAWQFDWITPAGDGAALAMAALPEAAERQRRAASAQPDAALRLQVASGPAWSGYFGVQLRAQGRGAPGLQAWLALVEMLPAGSEGNTGARQLVRSVAGPIALAELPASGEPPLTHLAAMRWPEGAKPERLQARAWAEDAQGHIVAVAHERCPAP